MLPDIHSPTMVLHRGDDRWVEVGNGRYLAGHIAGAKFVELPGADHRPWVEDADAVLNQVQAAVCGAVKRPRHANSSVGVHALSQREYEIIRLAVAGQSTHDIARHLFLSERTVETHLRNAYTKLDVNSKLSYPDEHPTSASEPTKDRFLCPREREAEGSDDGQELTDRHPDPAQKPTVYRQPSSGFRTGSRPDSV